VITRIGLDHCDWLGDTLDKIAAEKAGKASINYSANFGWQSPTELPEYVTSAQYATLTNEARAYAGKTPLYTAEQIQKYADGSDPYNYPNTNWQDLLYTESGFQQQHNISINGGDEKVRYMTSVGYQGQDGIIKHASKDQYNVRVNVDANPTSKLESNFSISYSNIALEEPTNPYVGGLAQIFRQVNMISPMVPYKKEDGTYGTIGDGNPIAWIDMDATTNKKRHNMLGVGSLKYSFLPELSIKGQASYKLYAEDSNEMRKDIQYNPNKYHGPNQMWQKDTFEDQVMGDIMLEYKKSFGLHNLNVLAGFHSELYKYKYTMAYRKNFPSNDLTDINAVFFVKFKSCVRALSELTFYTQAFHFELNAILQKRVAKDLSETANHLMIFNCHHTTLTA
jgi:hypothetical protein